LSDLEQELERLHGLPLDEFTSARNELAARLKQEGDAEAAAEVKGQTKPTVPVWTINQLARAERALVEELLKAGASLRKGQEQLLAGEGSDELSTATTAEREALSKLTQKAREVLQTVDRPASSATLDRIYSTLRAAAVDEEGRRQLERGWLDREFEASGFGAVGGLGAPARSGRRKQQPPDEQSEARRQRKEHQEQIRRLRADLRERERAARAAEREADQAEAAAAQAFAAAEEARRRVGDTEARLRELEL
jgi:hypothetical protein